jgi:hypothetical protein
VNRFVLTRYPWTVALAGIALLAAGCHHGAGGPSGEAAQGTDKPARSVVERGPVRLGVSVTPAKPRLSDEPILTVTIDYEQGVKVRKPAFGESIGDFLIRDFHTPPLRIEGNREIIEQTYTLEPTRTGKIFVLPIGITFTDARPHGDGKEHTLESEGLTVEVASVAGSTIPSLESLRPPAGPVELPESRAATARWLAGLAVLLAMAIGIIVWRRRVHARVTTAQAMSPRELAYLELQRLLEAKLAEGDVKLFYVELTGVVRRYIERTTGVRAPEQTTQEFLREISRAGTFAEDEGRRLVSFLEAADLVKFAAHRPRAEDVQESFRRAKAFIGLEPLEVAA